MSDYIVMLDDANSMTTKTVKVYLEDAGETRQIERKDVPIALDVDTYIANNFSSLWSSANPLASDIWDSAYEGKLRGLYRSVVRAGIEAGRVQGSTIVDVTDAMEAVIVASDKSAMYNKLKSISASGTAGQRDLLFLIVSFLTLNDLLSN